MAGVVATFEFLTDGAFRLAVLAGATATMVAAAVCGVGTGAGGRLRRLAGPAFLVPAAVVLAEQFHLPDGVLAGLVVLGAIGVLADRGDVPLAMAGALALPGGWLMGWHGDLVPVGWIRATVMLTAAVGGVAFAAFDQRWAARGYPPVFLAITTVGVYFTVPDPYEAIVLFGCAVPAAFLGWPRPLARFGALGALPAAGLLAWAVARGGVGRQSSIVGGVACLGLLILEPAHRRFRASHRSWMDGLPGGWQRWPIAAGAQLALVTVASRVAGVRSPAAYRDDGPLWRGAVAPAVGIVAAAAAISLLLMDAARRRGRAMGWPPARRRTPPR